jgi:uncharacterized protein YigA (DUF484 family)
MTQPTTELDGLLIESLTRLTAHLDEQNERIEHLTKQLNELPALAQHVEHLQQQVHSLTARLPA